MNEEISPAVPRAPRHFLRRGFAFLLDGLVAGVLAGFVLLGLLMVTGVDLGAASFANSTVCNEAPKDYPLVSRFDALWPPVAGEERDFRVCHTSTLGFAESHLFQAGVTQRDGATSYSRTVSVFADADGNLLAMQWTPDLSAPLIVLILGWFTANGRRPPGKMLLSLKVETVEGGPLTLGNAVWREALKQLPLLATFAAGIIFWLFQPAFISDFDQMVTALRDGRLLEGWMLTLLVGGTALPIIWWIVPFIFWRGQTWYDMIAAARVVKVATPIRRAPR